MIHWFIRFIQQLSTNITRWIPPALFTVLGITAVNLLWLIPAIQNIHSSASLVALELADRLRSDIEFGLETALNQTNEVADGIASEPDRSQIVLNGFLAHHANFQNIALVDKTGKEFMRADRSTETKSNDLRDHSRDPFFYLALQNAPNFWGVRETSNHESYATIAVPVTRNGTIMSVVVADLNIKSLIRPERTMRVSDAGYYVVDRDGFIILSSNLTQIANRQNIKDRTIVKKVVVDGHESNGLDDGELYINQQGEQMFAVGVPVALAGWGVFIEQARSQAFSGDRVVILFAVLTWLLGMVVVFFILRVTYRLERLNNRLNDLLKENYDVGKILIRRDIELTEANTRLMALDTSKSEFVSVAAHQLRTPVTGIRWSFNALLDGEMGEVNSDQHKILEDGLKSSMRMINLINDLLNVARIEEGRFGLHFKRQPFSVIIQGVIDRHHTAIEEKGILFFPDIQQGIPSLDLDEGKINIALDNLLDNAIKYTSPGGTITVKVKEEKNYVHVDISDTGIGIPPNQVEKLFVKFFRADNALRFQTSGSGLGLYVVKNIIEAHGGRITVTSEENKGTTFSLRIPIPSR